MFATTASPPRLVLTDDASVAGPDSAVADVVPGTGVQRLRPRRSTVSSVSSVTPRQSVATSCCDCSLCESSRASIVSTATRLGSVCNDRYTKPPLSRNPPRLGRWLRISIWVALLVLANHRLWSKPRVPALCSVLGLRCPKWPVGGYVKPGYDVIEAFRQNFDDGLEVGAGFAAYVGDELVVDIYGGYHDQTWRREYDPDSLQTVFSSSKVIEGMVVAHLVDVGLLSYDERISSYWPEFAQGNKENVTLEDLLGHRAGVSFLRRAPTLREIADLDQMAEILATQPHNFGGEDVQAYAGITRGWYLNEIIRRVHPRKRTIGQILRHEIMPKLNFEFYVGLPEDLDHRVSPMVGPQKLPSLFRMITPNIMQKQPPNPVVRAMFFSPLSITHRALRASAPRDEGIIGGPAYFNRRELMQSEGPSFSGLSNARSLARVAAVGANMGVLHGYRLFSVKTAAEAMMPLDWRIDAVVRRNVTFTRGGWGHGVKFPGTPVEWIGWGGAGGSMTYWNVERKVAFGYVPNSMGMTSMGDIRSWRLVEALMKSLDKIEASRDKDGTLSRDDSG